MNRPWTAAGRDNEIALSLGGDVATRVDGEHANNAVATSKASATVRISL
jgi:hypothetical protein